MIFCKIEDLKKYKNVSRNLSTAIDFILQTDLHNLPMGKTEIDGKNVYVTKMKVDAKKENELTFEAHRKYMDIHVDLAGQEVLCLSDAEDLMVTEPYNMEGDYELYESKNNSVKVFLKKNLFAVIDILEAHKPGILYNDKEIIKCVFKVLTD